jgi:hypothetical protein
MTDASAGAALRHLSSWGLVGGPTEPIDLVGIEGLAALAEQHRVTGMVLAAIDDGATTDAPAALVDDLADRHLRLLQQSLMAEADLVFVAQLFKSAGIEFRVLKGLATAHLDYPDPGLRLTSDVDLLVRRGQLDAATEVLRPYVDWELSYPDRSAKWAARYGKDRTLKLRDGSWIDLHQMLVAGYWGLVLDHDQFFDQGEQYSIAGTEMTALSSEHRLLHVLLHSGYSHVVKIQSFRDVVVLSARSVPSAAELAARRENQTIIGLLARGAQRTCELLDVDESWSSWASHVMPGWREQVALRTLTRVRHHWSGILAIGPHRWPGYILPIAFPTTDYLNWFGRSRTTHLRRAGWQSTCGRIGAHLD